ncbi:MAG: hypothetical protein R3E13_07320 [Alphaproteobacteria bacterium]
MADLSSLTIEIDALKHSLRSAGVEVGVAIDAPEEDLRLGLVAFLGKMNKVFGADTSIVSGDTYDPKVVENIRKGLQKILNEKDAGGKTEFECFEAIARGRKEDVDFITKDVTGTSWGFDKQKHARKTLNEIYAENSADPLKASRHVLLQLSEWEQGDQDDKVKPVTTFLGRLITDAPTLWHDIPLLVEFVRDSESTLNNLETLHGAGFFEDAVDAQALAELDEGQKLDADIKLVQATIGAPADGQWDDGDRLLFKELMRGFQHDPYFAEGWGGERNGVYTDEFKAHFAARVEAMPESSEDERLRKEGFRQYVAALETMEERGLKLRLARDEFTPESATRHVEEVLQMLAPELNAQLEIAAKKNKLPSALQEMLAVFGAAPDMGILKHRIPEVTKVDDVLDMRSQASLQGVLTLLSHPMLLGIKGGDSWRYTPEVGQHIVNNLDTLKKNLSGFMSEEDLEKFDELLEEKNVRKFIDALDHLYERGLIAGERIEYDRALVPAYTRELFNRLLTSQLDDEGKPIDGHAQAMKDAGAERMMDLVNTNPDMLRLLDTLTIEYTGRAGIARLMPEIEMPPIFSAGGDVRDEFANAGKVRSQQLYDFYKAARERHSGTAEEFNNDIFYLINTVATLPFGDAAYRGAFAQELGEVVKAAGAQSDPDKAAEVFAKGVSEKVAALHKDGVPAYKRYFEGDADAAQRMNPRLRALEIVSGGHTYTAHDFKQAYDDYMSFKAQALRGKMQKGGQGYVVFKGDKGPDGREDYYLMAVDKDSGVFSVEKIDAGVLAGIAKEHADKHYTEVWKLMEEASPAFALARSASPGAGWAELSAQIGAGDVPAFKDFAQDYRKQAELIERAVLEKGLRDAPSQTLVVSDEEFYGRPDAPRGGIDVIPHHDVAGLMDVGNAVKNGPVVIQPGEEDLWALLQRNSGKKLYRPNLGISGVDAEGGSPERPVMAHYDRRSAQVRLIEIPDELKGSEGLEVLKGLILPSQDFPVSEALLGKTVAQNVTDPNEESRRFGAVIVSSGTVIDENTLGLMREAGVGEVAVMGAAVNPQHFVEGMEMRPALFNLVCAEAGVSQKKEGERYSHDEIWALKKSLSRIVLSMEKGVSSGSGIRYAEPTAAQLTERARAEEFKRAAWEETQAKAQDEGRPLAVRRRAEADAGTGTDMDTRPSDSDVAAKPDADGHVAKLKPDDISGPV